MKDNLARGVFSNSRRLVTRGTNPKTRLLMRYERAQLEHYAGKWEKSSRFFDEAEAHATKTPPPGTFGSAQHEKKIPIQLQPFELAMASYYRAFNAIALGQKMQAANEARWGSQLLHWSVENRFHDPSGRVRREALSLSNNAFYDYLAAMLLEWNGLIDDAYIAYRNAAVAYHREREATGLALPPWLSCDLARVGKMAGFDRELEDLRLRFPDLAGCGRQPIGPSEKNGTVAIFIETGWVPEKQAFRIDLPILATDSHETIDDWVEVLVKRAVPGWTTTEPVENTLDIVMPMLVSDSESEVTVVALSVFSPEDDESADIRSAIVESVEKRAQMMLAAEAPETIARAILQSLFRTNFSEPKSPDWSKPRRIEKSGPKERFEEGISCWRTLPRNIWLFRLDLPPGEYDLRLQFRDAYDQVVAQGYLEDVVVTEGDWSFFNRRVF